MDKYDVGIIGAGVAGSFAAFTIAQNNKKCKTILFDLGRPPMKRRRQLEGWLGCLPNSDGKLYINDVQNIANLVGSDNAANSFQEFKKVFSLVDDFKIIRDRAPSVSMTKKMKKFGYQILLNDYIQIFPKTIHTLSKLMSEAIDKSTNIDCSFDDEVKSITREKDIFRVVTESKEYLCKKVIIAVGRSGWRWAQKLYHDLGLIENNNTSKF